MSRSFILQRLAATKKQIQAYEDAALALGSGGIQNYSLDTGQSKQTVTKLDLPNMQKVLDGLYNRVATLETRCGIGSGSRLVRPAW